MLEHCHQKFSCVSKKEQNKILVIVQPLVANLCIKLKFVFLLFIVTAATGLESTSVVFIYGLDLFCSRVNPSKGFDLLKDDFDYFVIASVLVGLTAAAYITRKLSQRKMLKSAWK